MERRTKKLLMLMSLRRVKGFGSKKIIDLINSNSLHYTHKRFYEEDENYRKIVEEEEKIINYCYDNKINIISYIDGHYPTKLKEINSPPIILFAKGDIGLLNKQAISIVGSRESSEKSLNWTYDICQELIEKDYVIVSGGAIGIDTSAHKSCLDKNGKTICVLGCGLDEIYPKENKELMQKIERNGLIITEYSPNKRVDKFSLLERNRITSGLGDKIIVVTTNLKGGSMSQVKKAISQEKEIFAPGISLSLQPNDGIKEIIKNHQATPIFGSEDLFKNKSRNSSQMDLLKSYS
ncbi:MAG: DNA-processing protein DprA [bacterium]